MNKLENETRQHRLIVLPLQPTSPNQFNGIGLALHFLMGNALAVNAYLKEFWFGWRVKKLFPHPDKLKTFNRGEADSLDLARLSDDQGIRFWLYGLTGTDRMTIYLFDGNDDKPAASTHLFYSFDDDLIGFRNALIQWLYDCGVHYPQPRIRAALWPEKMTPESADQFGRALEQFYIHSAYDDATTSMIDLAPYEAVVSAAPDSFMGQNLLGWAHYRNQDYQRARAAFMRAMQINPDSPGVVSGLMWCGVYTGNEPEAVYWACRKAAILDKDQEKARQTTLARIKKLE